MIAGYGSCFFCLFVLVFVCLYVCCFKDQGKVVARKKEKEGNPKWAKETYLVRSGNQSEHALNFLYCAPREVSYMYIQTVNTR